MAKILTTKGTAAALEDLIRHAQDEIYLISYSFIISNTFLKRLRQVANKGKIVNIVFGKSIKPPAMQELKLIENVRVYFLENLHAKIYANESKCIIGSMNFSESSENSNVELGVLLTKEGDKNAFDDALNHCRDILNEAQPVSPSSRKIREETFLSESRDKFVLKTLQKYYGPVSTEDLKYFKLKSYDMTVFLNDERIDFIYNNRNRYSLMRKEIEKILEQSINDALWVNSSRINITAKTNKDLGLAIKLVMGYTLTNLI